VNFIYVSKDYLFQKWNVLFGNIMYVFHFQNYECLLYAFSLFLFYKFDSGSMKSILEIYVSFQIPGVKNKDEKLNTLLIKGQA
jgi:hypothetical protein